MQKTTIKTTPNGPYQVSGDVDLVDSLGNPIPSKGGNTMFLCRCGASTTKPFCDGTHSKIGFQAAKEAVSGSEE